MYGSLQRNSRKELWHSVESLTPDSVEPWLLLGDFNEILLEEEKLGGASFNPNSASLFLDLMNKCQLMDLGSTGPKFTWRGPLLQGHRRIFERLDRGLVNADWQLAYPETCVRVLPRVKFDHHPILLDTSGFCARAKVQRPFRFMAARQTHSSFPSFFKEVWPLMKPLTVGLAITQKKLACWNKEVFQSTSRRKRSILARLARIKRISPQNRNPFLTK